MAQQVNSFKWAQKLVQMNQKIYKLKEYSYKWNQQIVSDETMKIEGHKKRLKESLDLIQESIEKGIIERQRTIGFHTSAASADMLEMLLHKKSLIDPGFVIKHEWLKSKKKTKEKLSFDFPKKKEIIDLICNIEEKRNSLCYGKPQEAEIIQEVIDDFNKLKDIFKEEGINEE